MAKGRKVVSDYDRGQRAWLSFVSRVGGFGCLKRKFPGEERRKVSVRIHQFVGNPHYHVDITEEDNPVWDAERAHWWSTFHDSNGRGATFACKFFRRPNAERFVKLVWDDWFNPATHVLEDSGTFGGAHATTLQRKFEKWSAKIGD
jgi:hypothetical protein